MFKKILIFILVAAMLSLTSCKVVEVIDHGTDSTEETTPPKEYAPWGIWYSSQTSSVIELTEGSAIAKLYSLTAGYYEYDMLWELPCTYDGDSTFVVTYEGTTMTCTFDKYANTLAASNVIYTPQEAAPTKHPVYDYPNYLDMDIDAFISVGDMDFASLLTATLEGCSFEIAKAFYGSAASIPVLENADRPVQSGDYVNFDYSGKLDGVAFDGGTKSGASTLISDYQNGYIPGFTDGMIGHSVGETFDVNVTFPEDYHAADLAGKAVVFTMKINKIYDLSLTDEQVVGYENNDYQTYAEWFEALKVNVAKSVLQTAILDLTTPTDEGIPSHVYLYYYQQTIDYLHAMAYYYQISYDLLLMYYGSSDEIIFQQSINEATYNMALFVLAEKHSLEWSQEDYDSKYEQYVTDYMEDNENATREEACEYTDDFILQIKLELTEEIVIEWALSFIFPAAE